MDYHIKDISLADKGEKRIEWASSNMPVLLSIRERFKKTKPFKDKKIACCLHVTTETANLMITLKEGGADVYLCASNPLSTQDDVASALVKNYSIPVFAIHGEDIETYYSHIRLVLGDKPDITVDDGADLVSTVHKEMRDLAEKIVGGTEETTTGVIRLKSLALRGELIYPIIAINDAKTKHLFDNRYGTGQSTIDGILRATNTLISGSTFVVCGYGWCGKGLAKRASGMGARVIVCEVDPIKALEAVMDGYQVMPFVESAKIGDIFITVTGDIRVIHKDGFNVMKDGVIIANSGHFDVEIDIKALEQMSKEKRIIRDGITQYILKDGRKINLLGEGRLVNLSCAEGHPPMVMDMSFANQALSMEYILKNADGLDKKVYPVPDEIDSEIAHLKLKTMGISIDRLTPEQEEYLASWEIGT
ncbi:MAG: adenosylhomocysteinase [bacterium]